ncbi:MAG: S8 family serine peptidase, partial [Elusimicrobia bacterium]|nr:S8 family serine peptidase [Elusimicrobiota bacterium]
FLRRACAASSGSRPGRAGALLALHFALALPTRALKTEVMGFAAARGGVQSLRVTSGQALLRLSSGTAPAALDGALRALGLERGTDLGRGWILVRWTGARGVAQTLTLLRALPGVAAADPSRVYSVNRTPSDPFVGAQYALSSVDALRGWDFEVGASSRATVAVVDSGIDGTHADLSAKLVNTVSMAFNPDTGASSANNPPTPACQHATQVAGAAAASTDNGLQVAGVSWGAQLVSLKVFLDADCPAANCSDSTCTTNDPGLIAALNEATSRQNTAAYGKVVVNMSLGGPGSCPAALQAAISAAAAAGVVVVAASGNTGGDVNVPGNCAGVIPAGATDSSDQVASFSSRGPELAAGGLVAPGVSVLTTDEGGGTASPSGTSFSAPMVAGAAALVLSAQPGYTPAQVRTTLRAGADDLGLSSQIQGAGRLNLYRSLGLAVNGSLPSANGVNSDPAPFAYPNPFRPSQTSLVSFSVPPSLTGGRIRVYTAQGRLVRELSVPTWDGRNADNNPVASGSYVFVVFLGDRSARGRVTVIR